MLEEKDIVCEATFIDEKKINKVKKHLPEENTLLGLSEIFKVLGDSTRLKILLSISSTELCVCDISALIGVSISAISHQLRLLKNARLVKYRKEGKMVYYSLDDNHIKSIVNEAKKHVEE